MRSSALFALVLVIAGWASYLPLQAYPSLRATMWPMLAALALGLILGLRTLVGDKQAPKGAKIVAALAVAGALLYLPAYLFVFRVPPASARPKVGEMLPEIVVKNHLDERVNSTAFVQNGPLLVVFFRGFW